MTRTTNSAIGKEANRPRSPRRWLRRVVRAALGLMAIIACVVGLYAFWFYHRSPPVPLHAQLMDGVVYERLVRQAPRPMVIHVATIDLARPGTSFVVDAPNPVDGHELRARTTSRFLTESECQVAINGGFFKLFKHGWGRDYPKNGDPVDAVSLAAFEGKVYNPPLLHYETFFISATNKVSIGKPIGAIYNAVSGGDFLLQAGRITTPPGGAAYPMTAAGLNATGTQLILIVVDGKQPGYSEGITIMELAELLQERGASDAMYFDGGGSSTLAVREPGGKAGVLNLPTNMGIVGLERPVGTHLGIRIPQ